jgi:hypothetical protein
MRDEARTRIALSALVFGVAAPACYVSERLLEWARGEAGDPRVILRALYTVYYWRVALAIWFGGTVAIIAHAHFTRHRASATLATRLAWLAVLVTVLFVIGAVRVP